MNGKCIYCLKIVKMSPEHFLPKCLGNFRNYESLHLKICEECNNSFTVFEEQFCRISLEGFYRFILGIQGRKNHEKYSPFYRGSSGGKRIEIKTKHPFLNVEIYLEPLELFGKVKPAKQFIIEDQDGKLQSILINEKLQNANDIKNVMNFIGIKRARFVQCLGEIDKYILDEICLLMDTKIKKIEDKRYEGDFEQLVNATFDITESFYRAIAKIAFHYVLKQLPILTGFESEFNGIKKYIMEGGENIWVQEIEGSFIANLNNGKSPLNYCHFLALEKTHQEIISKIQFFSGPKGPPHYYQVNIGRNPEKIFYPQKKGHQFQYFNKIDNEGYQGAMHELYMSKLYLPGNIEI